MRPLQQWRWRSFLSLGARSQTFYPATNCGCPINLIQYQEPTVSFMSIKHYLAATHPGCNVHMSPYSLGGEGATSNIVSRWCNSLQTSRKGPPAGFSGLQLSLHLLPKRQVFVHQRRVLHCQELLAKRDNDVSVVSNICISYCKEWNILCACTIKSEPVK